jgi:hypothetical protein
MAITNARSWAGTRCPNRITESTPARVERGVDVGGDHQPGDRLGAHEPALTQGAHPVQQPGVVPVRVEQHDRLVVHPQVARGPHLEQLLAGADPAGQRQERVGVRLHQRLALAHGVHHEQLVGLVVGPLPLDHRVRDHPDGAGAVLARGDGQRAHHRAAAAAGDQLPAPVPDRRADVGGQLEVVRRDALDGRAVHADPQCTSSQAR